MCNHKNIKCIKTTGEFYLYKCFERNCGEEWKVDKRIKSVKKTFLQKLFKK